jgi:TolB-like protein/DNA-binding winged helix-turn-helix (wHTH) protein/Tfp pilus assembly protein PilF
MTTELQRIYEFGSFRLDPDNRLLLRGGQPVPLTPKAFDLLQLLVENSGQLVLKDQIMNTVWPKTFVTEANLTQTVFMLRKALEDSADAQHYIATVSGRGYRFAGGVKKVGYGHPHSEAITEPVSAEPAPAKQPSPAQHWAILVGAVVVVAIAAAAGYLHWSRPAATAQPASGKHLVAVLPFENLTGDAEQDYFIDGLTAEIIVQLGSSDPQHLGVIARTSVMRYKKSVEQVRRIAGDLGVDYVLEGSVRRDAGKVRITAELIQARDQTHVWARDYDRELGSPLAIQGEVAREVSDEIQTVLGDRKAVEPVGQKLSAASREAREFYIRGRYFWNKRSGEGFRHAVGFFQQAIAKDPNYAPAYAGLSDCYVLMNSYFIGPPDELMPKARNAALRALQLDDKSAEAHTSLALIAEMYDWDWQTAEKEYRRAIQLNPNYATAHHWYAEFLGFEAMVESERAKSLDPLSLIIATDDAAILYYAGQYDRALEELQVVLDMEPDFLRARSLLIGSLMGKHLYEEALRYVDTWYDSSPLPWKWVMKSCIYARIGRKAEAHRLFERFRASSLWPSFNPTVIAAMLAMGNNDGAIAWLEDAYKHHSSIVISLKADHIFDPLRGDPRFQDLLRRVGLPSR